MLLFKLDLSAFKTNKVNESCDSIPFSEPSKKDKDGTWK